MVAGCPKCSARYRVDADKIGPDGAKLRCTKCSAVFLVRASSSAQANLPAAAAAQQVAVPPEPAKSLPSPELDSERLVLIADPEEARGKQTAEAIENWGLVPLLVHDGVEAMLAIQRTLPAVVVLDAALPKMFGFQVCEIVKRNESLRKIQVVLVGAIHHQDRYRRDPSELYGADAYVESPDLPDGLHSILRDIGLVVAAVTREPASTTQPSPVEQSPASIPEPVVQVQPNVSTSVEPAAVPSPVAPLKVEAASTPAVDESPEQTAERERALRLARIAVSEMVLYQPEKFDDASKAGTLEQTLDLEIQEARALLRQRIGDEIRAETDFIIDELHRVANERAEQG